MTLPAAAQHFADPAGASAYAAYRQAQIEEHGQWEATETILVGSVPGWTVGHSVPASTVEANPWMVEQGLVRRVAPPPEPGVDRAEQLRARQRAIAEEAAAIAAELATAEEDAAAEPAQYRGLNVDQLRDELRSRDLKVSGPRLQLVERLVADDADEHRESEEAVLPAADEKEE